MSPNASFSKSILTVASFFSVEEEVELVGSVSDINCPVSTGFVVVDSNDDDVVDDISSGAVEVIGAIVSIFSKSEDELLKLDELKIELELESDKVSGAI